MSPAARIRSARAKPWRALARLLRAGDGVSAVEFALLAPVLVMGTLSTVDIGRAVYEKMVIDQALRAGAQLAIAGKNENAIRDALEAVASENFTLSDGTGASGQLAVGVESYCGCPGTTAAQVDCTAVCDTGIDASRFWRLTASTSFKGTLLPAFPLASTLEVVAQ